MAPAVYAGDDMKMNAPCDMKMDTDSGMGMMGMNAAGDMKMGMGMHDYSATRADMGLAEGIVRTVDQQTGMVTIEHGEIKNVGMHPMTKAYKANNLAMVKIGRASRRE